MRTSSAGKTSKAGAGVTLIEMLVVVAIIGVIVAVSAPSVASGMDAVRMASATGSVAAFLNSAVNRAERRQQPIELVISLKDNELAIYSNEPGFTRELKLSGGIRIEAVLPKIDDEEQMRRLILMPGASVPGIGIQLVSQGTRRRVVRLDAMTGYPRVERVTTE